jgi:hypothetical protein
MIRRAGRAGFDSRHGKVFLYSTASIPALVLTQPPIQRNRGKALSLQVKRPGLEADLSPPSSTEVRTASVTGAKSKPRLQQKRSK